MTWPRFKVTLKGEDPVEVQTNARDNAALVMDPANPRPFDMTYRLVHNAMRRQQMSVPRDYEGFLEVLDANPEALDDGGDDDGLDPTQLDR